MELCIDCASGRLMGERSLGNTRRARRRCTRFARRCRRSDRHCGLRDALNANGAVFDDPAALGDSGVCSPRPLRGRAHDPDQQCRRRNWQQRLPDYSAAFSCHPRSPSRLPVQAGSEACERDHPGTGQTESQGSFGPWLWLNLWRFGSRSRSDASSTVWDCDVFAADDDLASAQLAAQDHLVSASIRPPLAAETAQLLSFSRFGIVARYSRRRVGASRYRHKVTVPVGLIRPVCSTITAESNTSIEG